MTVKASRTASGLPQGTKEGNPLLHTNSARATHGARSTHTHTHTRMQSTVDYLIHLPTKEKQKQWKAIQIKVIL